MSSGNSIIAVRGFSLWYGQTQALKGVDLDIPEKQVTAIIGPSGCGKSTFLKSLNRMTELVESVRYEGIIEFRQVPIQHYDPVDLRLQVGMVFQRPNPFPKTIFDNVVYGLRLQGIRKRRILEEAAERSLRQAALWDEVKDRQTESALELSGGQQQRLCIARALAIGPQVLLMDEPCSALDPIATAKIEDLIQDLKKDYTIVIVTHNMQQAARVSDMTAFFLAGELIEFDSTDKLFENPQDQRTEDYITGRFG